MVAARQCSRSIATGLRVSMRTTGNTLDGNTSDTGCLRVQATSTRHAMASKSAMLGQCRIVAQNYKKYFIMAP